MSGSDRGVDIRTIRALLGNEKLQTTARYTRRFLIHVLPKGFHRIRHYGLLANGKDEPNAEGSHRPAPSLRHTRPAQAASANLPGSLQLCQVSEDAKGPHTPRTHLQILDGSTGSLQANPDHHMAPGVVEREETLRRFHAAAGMHDHTINFDRAVRIVDTSLAA